MQLPMSIKKLQLYLRDNLSRIGFFMEKTELARIGKHLFGNRWKTPLAKAIGNQRETVSRWTSGNPISSVAAKAIRLLHQQDPQNHIEK